MISEHYAYSGAYHLNSPMVWLVLKLHCLNLGKRRRSEQNADPVSYESLRLKPLGYLIYKL